MPMKITFILQIFFLLIGTLTVFEYIFIRGMFTWLLAVIATMLAGGLNCVWSIKNKQYIQAYFYILCTVALCMGYFIAI